MRRRRNDIIFLDIQMEGMGGIEAARHLRQRGGDAVLVFITGIKDHVFEAFLMKAVVMRITTLSEGIVWVSL